MKDEWLDDSLFELLDDHINKCKKHDCWPCLPKMWREVAHYEKTCQNAWEAPVNRGDIVQLAWILRGKSRRHIVDYVEGRIPREWPKWHTFVHNHLSDSPKSPTEGYSSIDERRLNAMVDDLIKARDQYFHGHPCPFVQLPETLDEKTPQPWVNTVLAYAHWSVCRSEDHYPRTELLEIDRAFTELLEAYCRREIPQGQVRYLLEPAEKPSGLGKSAYIWMKVGTDSHGEPLWKIRYDTVERIFALKFCDTVARLLQSPNKPLAVTDLDPALEKKLEGILSFQRIADPEALQKYAASLKDIEIELEQARKDGDEAAVLRLKGEKEQVVAATSEAKAPGGIEKSLSSRAKAVQQSRNTVMKQRRTLLTHLTRFDLDDLVTHLKETINWSTDPQTNFPSLRYCPKTSLPWQISR